MILSGVGDMLPVSLMVVALGYLSCRIVVEKVSSVLREVSSAEGCCWLRYRDLQEPRLKVERGPRQLRDVRETQNSPVCGQVVDGKDHQHHELDKTYDLSSPGYVNTAYHR